MSDWLPKSQAGRRWLGLAPSYIVIGIFMLIPMVIMAVFSFLEPNPYGGVKPVGSWAAYIKIAFEYDLEDKLVFNPGYLNIIWRSFQLSFGATLLCLIFGFPVGFVGAAESKELLVNQCRNNVLFMTLSGRRGGSAMASAAVNSVAKHVQF